MAKPLKPFFRYFGSKWNIIKHYPEPKHKVLIEPFAGSATYSLHYPDKMVRLYDTNPHIVRAWDFLIHAKKKDVLGLKLPKKGQDLRQLGLDPGAESWIGFWIAQVGTHPQWTLTNWAFDKERGLLAKWDKIKCRTADQLKAIRHWTVELVSYEDIPNEKATWFVDPPYKVRGVSYGAHGSKHIDYKHLGKWCRERKGQVIVCEEYGMRWLPFKKLRVETGGKRASKNQEAIWIK